jgi:alpha-glucosidase
MAVVSFSPLQWIFWYDKPSAYEGEPEVEFFWQVPTVWDETRVLDGRVGEFAVLARRQGEAWFIGAINAESARTVRVPLTFLAPGRKYVAHIYSDDPAVATKTHVRVSTRIVGADAVLDVDMPVSGGQAIWLEAVKETR